MCCLFFVVGVFFLLNILTFFPLFSKSILSRVLYRGEKQTEVVLVWDNSLSVTDAVFKHCKIEFSLNAALTEEMYHNPCVFASRWLAHEHDDAHKLVVHSHHVLSKKSMEVDGIIASFLPPELNRADIAFQINLFRDNVCPC